jgi:hypothetical protein
MAGSIPSSEAAPYVWVTADILSMVIALIAAVVAWWTHLSTSETSESVTLANVPELPAFFDISGSFSFPWASAVRKDSSMHPRFVPHFIQKRDSSRKRLPQR